MSICINNNDLSLCNFPLCVNVWFIRARRWTLMNPGFSWGQLCILKKSCRKFRNISDRYCITNYLIAAGFSALWWPGQWLMNDSRDKDDVPDSLEDRRALHFLDNFYQKTFSHLPPWDTTELLKEDLTTSKYFHMSVVIWFYYLSSGLK